MSKNKRLLAIMLSTALLAMLAVTAVFAAYPASVEEGTAASEGSEILTGTLIGLEEGWGGNANTGRDAAFDGDLTTFFDPLGVGDGYCGIELSEAKELTEIRICPRGDQLGRFNGASIYGFNEGYNPDDTSLPAGAVLLWESMEAADVQEFRVIKQADFNADAKGKAFKYYIYYNEFEHGDVAEVEFWGAAAAAATPVAEEPAAPVETKDEPAAPVETKDEPVAEAVQEAAPEVTPVAPVTQSAPQTGDVTMMLIIVMALVSASAIMVVRRRNANRI